MSTYETGSSADQSAGSGDMKERAVEAVAEVDAGAMHVAGVAGEEAGNVAHDAKRAARGFFDETRAQLSEQASTQQRRAAGALRSTGDELVGLASGSGSGSSGMATSAVRTVGTQTRRVADWLEQREPAEVVDEVRGFARRHTGAFLAIALGVGIVAGRLTRALMADNGGGASDTSGGGRSMSGAGGGMTGGMSGGMGSGTGMAGGVSGSGAIPGGAAGAAGAAGAGSEWSGSAAGSGAGETPIADALTTEQGDPLAPGAEGTGTSGQGLADASATGEWSPGGEAQR